MAISVNGQEIPLRPMQLSFGANSRFIEAFITLFSGSQNNVPQQNLRSGNGISREKFAKGYAINAFDMTPDMCGSSPNFFEISQLTSSSPLRQHKQ